MDALEIIQAGGDVITLAILVALWKVDRRLLTMEAIVKKLNRET